MNTEIICPFCGCNNTSQARFCKECGKSLQTEQSSNAQQDDLATNSTATRQVSAEDMAHYARFQQALSDKADQVKAAEQAASYASQEYEQLKKRRTSCVVIGIIVALAMASFIFSSSSYEQTSTPLIGSLVGAIILGTYTFFFPFGFVPIKNFINNHGFFIIFTWAFLIIGIFIAFLTAAFIGLPYFIYLNRQIDSKKQEAEELKVHANKVRLEYQSM